MKKLAGQNRDADLPRSAVIDPVQQMSPAIQPSIGHDSLPYQDMDAMRRDEDSVFAKLGWTVDSRTHEAGIPDSILQKVREREIHAQASPATAPTASPRGYNTILPGAPATQNIHEPSGSPQGPTPNQRPRLSDKSTTANGGGEGHGPLPERPQP
jgi:hypothetical protein